MRHEVEKTVGAKNLSPSETITITNTVSGITSKGFFLGHGAPQWSSEKDIFIPRSQIVDCDTYLDEIEIGDEITIEIPLWLAREKGLD